MGSVVGVGCVDGGGGEEGVRWWWVEEVGPEIGVRGVVRMLVQLSKVDYTRR